MVPLCANSSDWSTIWVGRRFPNSSPEVGIPHGPLRCRVLPGRRVGAKRRHVACTAPRRASSKRRRTGGGSRTLVSCLGSRTLALERHRLRTGSRHAPGGMGTRRLSLSLSTASRNAHRTGRGALLRPWRPRWVSLPRHRRDVPVDPLADGPEYQARTIGSSVPLAVPQLPIGVTGPRSQARQITIPVCSSLFNVQMTSSTLVKMTRVTSPTRTARPVPLPRDGGPPHRRARSGARRESRVRSPRCPRKTKEPLPSGSGSSTITRTMEKSWL